MMFRGASALSLDSKGRLALPKRYRPVIDEECGGAMVCTIDHHLPCLLLYPLPEWERIEAKLARLSTLNPNERRLQRLLLGHAAECELDSQGRLLLAPTLRQYANLSSRVMLVGQLNKFEIWDEACWQQQIEQDKQQPLESTGELSERLNGLSL